MCDTRIIEYKIVPKDAFRILRSCSGCGQKMSYCSTGHFRINANKSLLDVWLIYQCPKCRHTYNLPVYERVRAAQIEPEEYQRFLKNDADTALRYGLDKRLFVRSRAQIDQDAVEYELIREENQPDETILAPLPELPRETQLFLIVRDPFELNVRADRLAAELLQISRSRVKRLLKDGEMEIRQDSAGVIIHGLGCRE